MVEPRTGRLLRWVRVLIAVVLGCCALLGASRLLVPATAGPTGEPPGVRGQLAFLRGALEDGAGDRAQQLFPEGYFFLYALYGLTWVELGMRAPAAERARPVREAAWALRQLESPAGRAPFSAGLTPSYGVFYQGWTNWLRGGLLGLEPAARREPDQVRRFEADSGALAAAFDAAATPYLQAYPGQAWPVDSTVAMASLRLHDTLLPPRFDGTRQRWLLGVRQRLDPATGLLPHRVDPDTGRPLDGARGSSQSIIERFLVDVDPTFAREQYLRFRDRYLVRPLGLGVAVREYPDGVDGPADVDSGPLPLGVSLSATVVAIGAAQVNGDAGVAAGLAGTAEVAGLPISTPWTKRYALGLVPVGDAFLAWAKTARPGIGPVPPAPGPGVPGWWRLPLLGLFAVLGVGPWLPALLRRYRRWRAPMARAAPAPG